MSPAARTLADFAGTWDLQRSIAQAGMPPGRFEGRAQWCPDDAGLAYLEEGTLMIEGQPPMAATRRYLWKPDLTVWFDDGRYFHTVPALGGEAAHWCDPDDYRVRYDFSDWVASGTPRFTATWRVRGPRKDYEMRSRYTKL